MKEVIILIALLTLLSSCSGDKNITEITYEKRLDLGEISRNDTIFKTIEIMNIGNNDLKIKNAKGSCNCILAVVDSSEFIQPSKIGEISLVYIPKESESGYQRQILVFESNTEPVLNSIHFKYKIID